MGEMSPWHWLIVIGVFALLFGAKRLPDAARSIGRSTRILKSELSGLREDDTPAPAPAAPAATAPAAAPGTASVAAPGTAPTVSAEKAAPQTTAG